MVNDNLKKRYIGSIINIISRDGIVSDGDWVESKDQDPNGDVRLIQLADIGDGEYRNRSERFLTLKKAKELNCTFIEKGDILIARMPDPLGRACIFPGDKKKSVTVVDVCIVRPGSGSVDSKWLTYTINSPEFRSNIAALESGTTRKRIAKSKLIEIPLPVPPLSEQHRIVSKIEELFTKLDAGVRNLKKIQKEIKRYRQAALKYAFEGKLTEEWRKANKDKLEPASELLKRIKEERKKALVGKYRELPTVDKSKFSELPKGWEIASLGDLYEIVGGGTPSTDKKNYWNGKIPWISSADISGIDKIEIRRYITKEAISDSATNLVPADTIIVVTRVGLGKVAFAKADMCFSQDCQGLLPQNNLFSRYVLWYLTVATQIFKAQSRGTTIPGVTKKQLSALMVQIPSFKEQQKIVEEIERLFSVADEVEQVIEKSLKEAERLRQSILKIAFEGRLVPQDPNDEPAEKLLERIKAERNAGGQKKNKNKTLDSGSMSGMTR